MVERAVTYWAAHRTTPINYEYHVEVPSAKSGVYQLPILQEAFKWVMLKSDQPGSWREHMPDLCDTAAAAGRSIVYINMKGEEKIDPLANK